MVRRTETKPFELAAVCDLNPRIAHEAAEKWRVTAYTSLDALLADERIRVVGLFTQPNGRAELLRRIIRADKDALTTKPFELDPAEARSVAEEARARGRIIHANSPGPVRPLDLQVIDAWRLEHDLGRPVAARAAVWAPYREAADGSWLDDPEQCPAAPLFRLGIYLLNDLHDLLGPAASVQVMTSRLRTGRPTPDNAQMNVRYRGGVLGQVSASFCVDDGDAYQNSLTLHFERGTVYRNAGGIRMRHEPGSAEMVLVGRGKGGREVRAQRHVPDASGNYAWQALAEAVRSGSGMDEAYVERLVESARLVDALRRAQPDGCAVL